LGFSDKASRTATELFIFLNLGSEKNGSPCTFSDGAICVLGWLESDRFKKRERIGYQRTDNAKSGHRKPADNFQSIWERFLRIKQKKGERAFSFDESQL